MVEPPPTQKSIEPFVAAHNIDNMLAEADLKNDQRQLHQHVDKTLEQQSELNRMRQKNFMETAAAVQDELVAKENKDRVEAVKPKVRGIEVINLDTTIRQVEAALLETIYRSEVAGDFVVVECEKMLRDTQRPVFDSPSSWIRIVSG